jgi:hypothetical protein
LKNSGWEFGFSSEKFSTVSICRYAQNGWFSGQAMSLTIILPKNYSALKTAQE